ncbi:hypothetical protein [Nonomuraea insulae]|uniref:NADH-quinone oxidoreductase subunit M n=1 Tax=Nonomuraea insulae TaxID=1616787 RepID=A0ABW1CDW2_9ACTN
MNALSTVIFLPLVAAAALALPRLGARAAIRIWIAATAADLALVVAMWIGYGGGLAYQTRLRWIPSVGAGYHVGVDGLSLPLIAMTSLLFLLCAVYSLRETHRPRAYAALFLFLQTVCLGLFAALDLLLWHGTAERRTGTVALLAATASLALGMAVLLGYLQP